MVDEERVARRLPWVHDLPLMRLLVTGASGLLGARLALAQAKTWDVTGTYHTQHDLVPREIAAVPLELRDATAVASLFERTRPDAVVHAAAMANVQSCQAAPRDAEACNRDGARHVAQHARRRQVPLVYLSTDLVFDGRRGWYSDSEVPSPSCTYGLTKHAGEQMVQSEHPDACILRIALTYGWSANARRSYLAWLIAALRRGEQVTLFVDEFRTPVLIDDLCRTVDTAISANLRGICHVAGPRRLSRYDLAVEAARAFRLPTDGIIPATRGPHETFR
ncbi:MAG: NAD(P)-dependent oxidoreductase, partial [Anaerolineae bacterium]